jgi:hypothetical protein
MQWGFSATGPPDGNSAEFSRRNQTIVLLIRVAVKSS